VSTAFGVTRANRRWLSQATGQQVFGFDGRRLGRVADLSIGLDAAGGPPRVRRLVIRRRSAPNALVPWAAVVESDRDRVCLNEDATAAAESAAVALASDEILLARDVLDTQVVDVAGQRLARVVHLTDPATWSWPARRTTRSKCSASNSDLAESSADSECEASQGTSARTWCRGTTCT
jgi:sporulation protein YlmC with PRC-barrel domain